MLQKYLCNFRWRKASWVETCTDKNKDKEINVVEKK